MQREERLPSRTFAVAGGTGSGKTTLLEAMIHASGGSERLRRPDDGTSVLDSDPDARRRHMTVAASVASLTWRDVTLHAIDTPGYFDFETDLRAALSAADAMLLAVDAAAGVDPAAEAVCAHADALARESQRALPRLVVVTRLDRLPAERREGYALPAGLAELCGRGLIPLQLPVWRDGRLAGLLDLVDGGLRDPVSAEVLAAADPTTGLVPPDALPPGLGEAAAAARQALVELAAEQDDDLLERYLEGETLAAQDVRSALRRGVAAGAVIPACYAAAGAQDAPLGGARALLDALVDLAPAPGEVPTHAATADGSTLEVAADPNAPLLALCWKTVADPYVGRLSYMRVFAGTLRIDAHPASAHAGRESQTERVGQMLHWPGGEQQPATVAGPGAVLAVPKLQHTLAGDALADPARVVTIAWPAAAQPVHAVAVSPRRRTDEERLGPALARLCEEDPALRVVHEPETHQTVLWGCGDVHLDVALSRLRRKFGVEVDTAPPRVAFRETIAHPAKAEGKHKKQTGGHGQYGHVFLEVAPLPRGTGFSFQEKVFGGAVPRQYIPAVEKGVQEAMQAGVLAGYPVTDIQVTLTDGSSHPVDSSEMAFKLAAGLAFRKACQEAAPQLLEPVGDLTVEAPEACLGDVMSDLNKRRARISGVEIADGPDARSTSAGALQRLGATVPLVEMGTYSVDLRSITAGRAHFRLAFTQYEQAPPQVLQVAQAAASALREKAAAE